MGIYIHWPFCEAKCPYCDFNSHVVRSIDQDRWKRAYLTELDRYAAEFPENTIRSVFFGGGTPSLMEPATVAAILDRISRNWRISNNIEITLEANPSSVETDRFTAYRNAGINRVSLGVQSLLDEHLKKLGRLHSAHEALVALDVAGSTFDRFSFDLIYGRQDQSLIAWEAELKQALSLGSDHVSLYQLTIEPGTAFGDRYRRGKLGGLPDEDLGADMYALTLAMCDAQGLPLYEVSNYARPGEESRHNLIYWKYGNYLGIGPGAHGRISSPGNGKMATETLLNPQNWLKAVEGPSGQESRSVLSPEDQGDEFVLMGLRLRSGIDMSRYQHLTGRSLNVSAIDELVYDGVLRIDDGMLAVNPESMAVLNYIIERIVPS